DLAAVRDLPVQAVALLHPRRGGRPARRREHRPLREDARGSQGADPVRPHHPQPQDHGNRGSALRGHHGGAGRQQVGERKVPRTPRAPPPSLPRPSRGRARGATSSPSAPPPPSSPSRSPAAAPPPPPHPPPRSRAVPTAGTGRSRRARSATTATRRTTTTAS